MRLNGESMLAVIVGCALGVGQASAQQGATGGEWRNHSGERTVRRQNRQRAASSRRV